MQTWLYVTANLYAAIGVVVGFAFALFGIDRVDPASHGAYAARALLLPGFILLWPLVLIRWGQLEVQRSRLGTG